MSEHGNCGIDGGVSEADAYAARREKLDEGLHTLAAWCIKRTVGGHHVETTLTMLERRVFELRDAVLGKQ